jgi:hypothetical protein
MRSQLYGVMDEQLGLGRLDLLASLALFDNDPARINTLEAGFADVAVEQRPAVQYFASADDYFLWLKASSFGRQSRAPEHVRAEARRRISEALEQRRTPQGIEVRSSHLFATASRPR